MTINKEEFVDDLAKRTGFPKYKSRIFYNAFVDLMREYLLAGDTVKIHELFIAEVKEYKGYSGTNPNTHEPINVPPFRKARIRVAKKINDVIKENSKLME